MLLHLLLFGKLTSKTWQRSNWVWYSPSPRRQAQHQLQQLRTSAGLPSCRSVHGKHDAWCQSYVPSAATLWAREQLAWLGIQPVCPHFPSPATARSHKNHTHQSINQSFSQSINWFLLWHHIPPGMFDKLHTTLQETEQCNEHIIIIMWLVL